MLLGSCSSSSNESASEPLICDGSTEVAAASGFGSSTQPLLTNNKLATNKLATNKLATNKLATNKLATNKLATNKLATNKLATNHIALNRLDVETLGLTELLATAENREYLKYLFECALSADTVLEMPLPSDSTPERASAVAQPTSDDTVEFSGSIGLAAGWLDHPLTLAERRWVSACLLSRVNAFGISVEISMRGPNDALQVDEAERRDWSLPEGAFFGDLFSDPDSPILGYSCRAPVVTGGTSESREHRVCTEADPQHPGFTRCGLVDLGECDGLGAGALTCKARTITGEYTGCLPPDAKDPTPARCPAAGENAYAEVITTFLQE
jgi:hypothetical protein